MRCLLNSLVLMTFLQRNVRHPWCMLLKQFVRTRPQVLKERERNRQSMGQQQRGGINRLPEDIDVR